MTVRTILKMGDPRLLAIARPVERFATPELRALVADLFETMHAANGAGLAAPQIGVDLQLVIFGFDRNERYPDAPPVPETILVNPTIEAASRCRGCAASCRASRASATAASTSTAARSNARRKDFTLASSSTNATIWSASSTRCGSATSAASASPASCFPGWMPGPTTEPEAPGLL
jgi:hypothetical protein